MSAFKPFAAAIKKQIQELSLSGLFTVALDGDTIWDLYLASFPEGTNPMFRKRTEHDGSYDRNFIRKMGNVVSIAPTGKMYSIWDAPDLESPYKEVAKALSKAVKASPITNVFRSNEKTIGYEETKEFTTTGDVIVWNHFNAEIDAVHYTKDVDTFLGNISTTHAVFKRGVEEITAEALQIILDLITDNNLYRGKEFEAVVTDFKNAVDKYSSLGTAEQKNNFLWAHIYGKNARFRNTVIGTLATDLSTGTPTDVAVNAFEHKTAPTNYKRTTAVVTQGMVAAALKTIQEDNLESALQRRMARISDTKITDVIWANSSASSQMKDGVAGILEAIAKEYSKPNPNEEATPVSIDDFIANVVPTAVKMNVLFKNANQKNLMTLTAPVEENVSPLFKWNNNFAWSYNGDITDSIKERVKAAGGKVDTDLRISLAWYNRDDLDIHVTDPLGNHIYFGNKSPRTSQGTLDVDMNAFGEISRTPVENVYFTRPVNGKYTVKVNNYARRETNDVGFELQIACKSLTRSFKHSKALNNSISALSFTVMNGVISSVFLENSNMVSEQTAISTWGISTESFIPVKTLLLSPNYWGDNSVGNKHWFFILENCICPDSVRGIYNEFLNSTLDKHRKVFEVLGNRTKCAPTADQLSGVGFSSTNNDTVKVLVVTKDTRKLYEVIF